MKKIYVFIILIPIFLTACSSPSVYQEYGRHLTQFNNGKVITDKKDMFVYELNSQDISLSVKLYDQSALLVMVINNDKIDFKVNYDLCTKSYEFIETSAYGNEDIDFLKNSFMEEFDRLLETELFEFVELMNSYCLKVK